MKELIQTIIDGLQLAVQTSNPIVSIFVGMFVIILESMIPILPLALFIAINMLTFGNFVGFIISWIATIIGCTISFYLFRHLQRHATRMIDKKPKLKIVIDKISNISFSSLVMILSIPFTPAFSVNIGAGLSNMPYRKYFCALCISKLFLVYFWGFIGTTFLESITDIGVIVKLFAMVSFAFILSKLIMHKFEIE